MRQWRDYLAENESSLLKRKDLFAYFYELSFRKDKNKLGNSLRQLFRSNKFYEHYLYHIPYYLYPNQRYSSSYHQIIHKKPSRQQL